MKQTILLAFLLILVNYANAAFPIKAATTATGPAVVSQTSGAVVHERHSGFFSRLKDWVSPYRGEYGEGDRAMFWGLLGLFLWPLGVLAIIHGIRGIGSHRPRQQDLATLGLILGIGEVAACVLAVIFFFLWF